MEFVSRFLSWLFLPLFAPVIAIAVAMYLETYEPGIWQRGNIYLLRPDHKKLLIYLFVALSAVFPILTILFFRINGTISTIFMDNRSERILPAIFVNGSAITLYILLLKLDPNGYLPSAIYGLVLGSCIAVLLCTIITFRWKISLHSAGMGILTGFVFVYYNSMNLYPFWVLPGVLIASGLVMSARMYLKAHTFAELFGGYALGTSVVAVTTWMYMH